MIAWCAVGLTFLGLWLLGGGTREDRSWGFGVGLVANGLWIAAYFSDPALVAVNGVLAVLNLRGYLRA